jgi:hypothetical protein
MKKDKLKSYLSIGYKQVNCKNYCDGCGNFTVVLEYGGMTDSGYESDYIYCLSRLDIKHPLNTINPSSLN